MSFWQAIKNFLKRILPPPTEVFHREIDYVLGDIAAERKEISKLEHIVSLQSKELAEIKSVLISQQQSKELAEIKSMLLSQQRNIAEIEEKQDESAEELKLKVGECSTKIESCREMAKLSEDKLEKLTTDNNRTINEAVWAAIFHDSIRESLWLKDKTFSPGRWAIGYPCLYVLYRILDEFRPKNILELGLGQSTKMLAQYARANEDVSHTVVEDSTEWADFFIKKGMFSKNSTVVQLPCEMVGYNKEKVRVYQDFEKTFIGRKFDLIFIDAPLGGDLEAYARIDVLSILPDCLKESFVLVMDDYNRQTEKKTCNEIEKLLLKNDIEIKKGNYSGKKDTLVIASINQSFLCTM